ncbi:MAG: hypothetical protein L0H93_01940 [Nocardioides sp.]|nr:hypothetical protein [Nocardioides sp.]
MRFPHLWAPVLLLALTLGTAAGCGGDPEPLPVPAGGTAKKSEPARHRVPKWHKDYSGAQVVAYREARGRWKAYTRRSERIWSSGRATPAAQELFADFFYQPAVMYQLLESYEKRKVTLRGMPLVLDSRPAQVSLDADPVTVVIRQCIDPRPVQLAADGVPLSDPDQKPTVRTITLSKVDGGPFQVLEYKGPETGDKTPCR